MTVAQGELAHLAGALRGAEMLNEEIQYQQPQRRSVIEEAQMKIVGIIRRLEEAGAIVVGRPGMEEEDDDVVL